MLVFDTLLDDPQAYERMSKAVNPYGNGKACDKIVRALKGERVERAYARCQASKRGITYCVKSNLQALLNRK